MKKAALFMMMVALITMMITIKSFYYIFGLQ